MASTNTPNAVSRSNSSALPSSTSIFLAAAWEQTSVSRWVLPMPASPESSAMAPPPESTSSSSAAKSVNSRARPMILLEPAISPLGNGQANPIAGGKGALTGARPRELGAGLVLDADLELAGGATGLLGRHRLAAG